LVRWVGGTRVFLGSYKPECMVREGVNLYWWYVWYVLLAPVEPPLANDPGNRDIWDLVLCVVCACGCVDVWEGTLSVTITKSAGLGHPEKPVLKVPRLIT
jgi:hypothetical protein